MIAKLLQLAGTRKLTRAECMALQSAGLRPNGERWRIGTRQKVRRVTTEGKVTVHVDEIAKPGESVSVELVGGKIVLMKVDG